MPVDYVRIVLALAVSLGVGVAAIWLLSRRGVGRLGGPRDRSARIEVLEVRPLGGRTSLVALRYRGREALVVLGPGHASTVLVDTAGPAEGAP